MAGALVMVSLGLPGAALGDGAAPSQPSAIERLVRQEEARKAELARFTEIAMRHGAATRLVARERAMFERPGATSRSVSPATAAGVGRTFAWGAAALGLGAGVAGTCVLLGCVMVFLGPGRLRGV